MKLYNPNANLITITCICGHRVENVLKAKEKNESNDDVLTH